MSDSRRGRRIGDVAAAAGVTIRTLHHYESIGLLTPAARTAAGYRLYDDDSVQRIYRICVLRRLGMSLNQIGSALDGDEWTLTGSLQAHLNDVEQRLVAAQRLRAGLVQVLAESDVEHPIPDLMEVLIDMSTLDRPIEQRIQILV